MSWITVGWSMASAMCATLALIHLAIWLQRRSQIAHFLFALSALGAAGNGLAELVMLTAASVDAYVSALRVLTYASTLAAFSITSSARPFPAAPRALSAKRKWAICERLWSQIARWIRASVAHMADAIDQPTVIQLIAASGSKLGHEFVGELKASAELLQSDGESPHLLLASCWFLRVPSHSCFYPRNCSRFYAEQ